MENVERKAGRGSLHRMVRCCSLYTDEKLDQQEQKPSGDTENDNAYWLLIPMITVVVVVVLWR